jgi:hypothetical protein
MGNLPWPMLNSTCVSIRVRSAGKTKALGAALHGGARGHRMGVVCRLCLLLPDAGVPKPWHATSDAWAPGIHVRIWPPAEVAFNCLTAASGCLPDVPGQALRGCDLRRTDSTYDARYGKVPLTDQLDYKLRH